MAHEEFLDTFKEEALELLGSLEASLLDLEQNPEDTELLSAVFRVMHTIKGSSSMFALEKISSFAHEIESILSALRDGHLSVSSALISHTLEARDIILSMLDDFEGAKTPMSSEMANFIDIFKDDVGFSDTVFLKGPNSSVVSSDELIEEVPLPEKTLGTWYISYKPGKPTFKMGGNPLVMLKELANLGEFSCTPDFDSVPSLDALDPEDCVLGWTLFLTAKVTENDLRDIFIFADDSSVIKIESLPDDAAYTPRKLGEILVQRGHVDGVSLENFLNSQKRIGELLVDTKTITPAKLQSALDEQQHLQKIQKTRQSAVDSNTIRVKSQKLDQLMSLVGELVTVHARIFQTVRQSSHDEELLGVVEHLGRLTDELRSNTMSIRMVPIGTTFSTFKRLVRDLSSELGKSVELVTEGEETELDKTVIEKLNDPLVHLIRNCLDHGIEMPEIRKAAGKSEQGTVRLAAIQAGASVHVVIEDDGNGLDKTKIRQKALKNGLIKEDEVLSEQDIYSLIFAAGFSTKENVSAVSGRGVGMDVVKRQMEIINGSIAVETKQGAFTRITLKIPLTLAIIDGLLIRLGEAFYIVPLSVVTGCMEYIVAKSADSKRIVIFQDHQLPFVCMRDFFTVSGEPPEIQQMVIVKIKNRLVGLLVDQVIGGNQTVIKPLGKLLKRAEGVSSATILGDGSVALILDVEQILESSEKSMV